MLALAQYRHLEVTNIVAWISGFLKRNGIEQRIIYEGLPQWKSCWQLAMALPRSDTGLYKWLPSTPGRLTRLCGNALRFVAKEIDHVRGCGFLSSTPNGETHPISVHYKVVIVEKTQEINSEVMRFLAAIVKT